MAGLVPVFDLDGTLMDSDAALAAAFVACGVAAEEVTYGHTLAEECERLGITVADYIGHYDVEAAQPYPGVTDLLALLDRWAVCSNKHARSGRAELAKLGSRPEVALFAEDFGGAPKRLGPVLDTLDLDPGAVTFVGDTDHDRRCAAAVGCPFVLAGWNSRAEARPGDLVATEPAEVSRFLRR